MARYVSNYSGPEIDALLASIGGGGGGGVTVFDSIKDLVDYGTPTDIEITIVVSYHSGKSIGGGIFRWAADKSKSEHDGGIVIDPTAPYPSNWNDENDKKAWFTSSNSGSGCWVRVIQGHVDPSWFGAYPSSSDSATQSFQAALDYVHYALGGGVVSVSVPGAYRLTPSVLNEEYSNYGTPYGSDGTCIVIRDKVSLHGYGVTLVPSNVSKTCIYIIGQNDISIAGLEITSGFSGSGNGHGIFQVFGTQNPPSQYVRNLRFKDLYIHNIGAYGIGLQNGWMDGIYFDNLRIHSTGTDAIDVKNRFEPCPNIGIVLNNVYVSNHGMRLDGSAGIDIRGRFTASNVQVTNFGSPVRQLYGFRFRTHGNVGPDEWPARSSLTNFYIEGGNNATGGLYIGSPDVMISNGCIKNCGTGVIFTGNVDGAPQRVAITNVNVIDCTTGYDMSSTCTAPRFVACTARGCTTGFRSTADHCHYIGCYAEDCDTALYTSVSADDTQQIIGGNLYPAMFRMRREGSTVAKLQAFGNESDIDLELEPKGSGYVCFGVRTATSDVPITGYIQIKDKGGTVRKLAVIS